VTLVTVNTGAADGRPMMRALLVGGSVQSPLILTLAWMAGLLAVFVTLSVLRYRRGG